MREILIKNAEIIRLIGILLGLFNIILSIGAIESMSHTPDTEESLIIGSFIITNAVFLIPQTLLNSKIKVSLYCLSALISVLVFIKSFLKLPFVPNSFFVSIFAYIFFIFFILIMTICLSIASLKGSKQKSHSSAIKKH